MAMSIMLDSGPLGRICNPAPTPETERASIWIAGQIDAGGRLLIPEIADYEVRRELIRSGRRRSLMRLDRWIELNEHVAITTDAMRFAAELWAASRKVGRPTAHNADLDGDVILAAQAILYADRGTEVTVLTMNEAHLAAFVPTLNWNQIA
jgi:hypothetical protein